MNAEGGLAKVEGLIMPVSAAVTFFGEDIQLLGAGDFNAIIAKEAGYLRSWHPPTLLGLTNMIGGPLGQGAFTAVAGWAIEQVGAVMGSGLVGRIGKDFKHVGQGVIVGGLADGLVRPSKYNPGRGASSDAALHDPVMRSASYYESTAHAPIAAGVPR